MSATPDSTNSTHLSPIQGLSSVRVAGYAAIFTVIQLAYHAVSDMPFSADYLVVSAVGAVLAAWLLSVLFLTIPLKPFGRLATVWFALFIVQVFADLIEGVFFTTRISTLSMFLGATVVGLVITFLDSLAGLLLFSTASLPLSLRLVLRLHFTKGVWLFRLAVGSVAYFPVYFLFGALVSPFVIPYYTDQSLGLGLTIPSFSILIPIELLRGFLFVLALVPLIVTVKLSRDSTFTFLALFLYVIGAYVPFVAGTTLPWTLKLYHSLEIFGDSVMYGAILTYLFKRQQ